MKWHESTASAVGTNESGDTVAVIVREQYAGEKCRLYVNKYGTAVDGAVFETLAKAKDAAEEAAKA
jgi:hypothetical protein